VLKVVSLFLVVIVALAFFGRIRFGSKPGGTRIGGITPPRMAKPQKCPSCGRFLIGTGPCECGAPRA
jgi:hypothetical protein